MVALAARPWAVLAAEIARSVVVPADMAAADTSPRMVSSRDV